REDAGAASHLLPAGLLFEVRAAAVDSGAVREAAAAARSTLAGLMPRPDPGARLPVRAAWSALHLHRAEYFTLFGLHDLAAAEGRRALAWLPGQAVAWYNLGYNLVNLARPDEAAEALRAALDVDENVTGPRTLLAHLALAAGDRTAAAAWVRDELARHPDDPQARALADFLAGR
ncbi:hypothetical protein KDM41_16145, partial [bacterium]|nr:hypothetical protein [bacterium]